jgi:hypothetical protein
MKYIKFVFRDKKTITLSFDQAERVINSTQQQVKILNEKSNWTGILINKAEIVKTEIDWEKMREEKLRLAQPEEDKVLSEEEQKAEDERWKKLRIDIENLGIIKKLS